MTSTVWLMAVPLAKNHTLKFDISMEIDLNLAGPKTNICFVFQPVKIVLRKCLFTSSGEFSGAVRVASYVLPSPRSRGDVLACLANRQKELQLLLSMWAVLSLGLV